MRSRMWQKIVIICLSHFVCCSVEDTRDWETPAPESLLVSIDSVDESINSPVTPSHECHVIVEHFGLAISNFTLCSVKNAHPIHLCENCVKTYLEVVFAHNKFEATIDEQGKKCREYFIDLDRLQIVSEAYKYVHHLWRKANCRSCFKKTKNGTMTAEPTDQILEFNKHYIQTHMCFRNHTTDTSNVTCAVCQKDYDELTDSYIDILNSFGDDLCMDVVDSMNITRFKWSSYGCVKRQDVPLPLKIGLGLMSLLPVTFYLVAYFLASKQEAPILQQKRLAEIFAVNSSSGNLFVPNPVSRTSTLSGLAGRIIRRHR